MGIFQSIQRRHKKLWKGNYYDGSVEDDKRADGSLDYEERDTSQGHDASLFFGEHEIEVSEGGEADLHEHMRTCLKNPGHTKFNPINDFNISHLLPGYNDDDTLKYIKATADLTVRIAVETTSAERRKFWPNTDFPYPLYNDRGSDCLRTGTGMVRLVFKWTEGDVKTHNMGHCACQKCQTSDTPSNEWGVVWMYTATHLVFDDLEARHTTCRLFYDTQESPLVTLGGWTMMSANVAEDWCKLKCVTCDVDLLDKLIQMLSYRNFLWRKLNNKCNSSRAEGQLTFIVSHPHGCSKQVTVGRWTNKFSKEHWIDKCFIGHWIDKRFIGRWIDMCPRGHWIYKCFIGHWIDRWRLGCFSTKYIYETCTCKGSSGAYVHSLGLDWSYVSHVHSGFNDIKRQNYCSTGWDFWCPPKK